MSPIKPITIMYLIDTYVSPPGTSEKGGAEKQLHMLASGLNPDLFRPIIVQLNSGTVPLADGLFGNVRIHHLATRRFYSFHGLRQLGHLISLARKEQVAVIQTFFEKSEVMGWLTKRLTGTPVWITSRRDLGFKRKKAYDLLFSLASADCTSCIANCAAVKRQAMEREKMPAEKVEVIYNGMDFSLYREPGNGVAIREKLGIAPGTPLVGMIANLNFEIKGHRHLLEAARQVIGSNPSARFLLVGDGPLRPQFETMARDLGIEQEVIFLGKRADIPEILAALDISVLCSTSEGLSNVIMESMAAGKPVVATRIGGNPELVVDGVTGLLVPPADAWALAEAIGSLLARPDRGKSLGEAGKVLINGKISVEAMVRAHEKLYLNYLGAD